MNLNESTLAPLVTPEFFGTDEEKIAVLSYWSEIIGLIRSIGVSVPSHENKLSIISQLKKEIELLELEYTNTTSQPVQGEDGETSLEKVPEDDTVDLSQPEPQTPDYPAPSPFTPHRPLTTVQARKLAGIR